MGSIRESLLPALARLRQTFRTFTCQLYCSGAAEAARDWNFGQLADVLSKCARVNYQKWRGN